MTARDDYPMPAWDRAWQSRASAAQWTSMCDEIDRLRAIKKSDDGAYEHVVEMYHAEHEEVSRLRDEMQTLRDELAAAVGYIRIQEGITS